MIGKIQILRWNEQTFRALWWNNLEMTSDLLCVCLCLNLMYCYYQLFKLYSVFFLFVCICLGEMDDVLDCVCPIHCGGDHHWPNIGMVSCTQTLNGHIVANIATPIWSPLADVNTVTKWKSTWILQVYQSWLADTLLARVPLVDCA